tara:strand:+ start:2019 stop:2348 length:330 start_codon:yes stop_codon:yes gene_type:complete
MSKVFAIKVDIEDYYGMAMDTIIFEDTIEIEPEEFSLRVDQFVYAGCDDCDDKEGATIRLQFEHEDSNGEEEDIDFTTQQIVDVILDYAENESESYLYERIHNALELIM